MVYLSFNVCIYFLIIYHERLKYYDVILSTVLSCLLIQNYVGEWGYTYWQVSNDDGAVTAAYLN